MLDEANRQIFASRYRLELPSEEELRRELERERRLLEEQESGFEAKEGRVVYGKRLKRKKR